MLSCYGSQSIGRVEWRLLTDHFCSVTDFLSYFYFLSSVHCIKIDSDFSGNSIEEFL